ncbi:MAG: hypothetical protein FWC77_01265 [Defluviitaleaceae bacterium]|nr:hypothetical protein [Defluviitaleaceae bacterium]
MSTHPIILKPIDEVAKYKRTLIPKNIPKAYALKPMFESIASGDEVRTGVIAFRGFLYELFDRLVLEGHMYAKPPNKPGGMADYPFLHYLTNILVEIGYHGEFTDNRNSLKVAIMPLATPTVDENGRKKSAKIPTSNLVECLKFLKLCGFDFASAGLEAKKPGIMEILPLTVSFPNDPILLTGLKALSVADIERRNGRAYWNDHNLLRCNYRLLKAEESDIVDELKDFLNSLPKQVQAFALKLHQRYTDMGLTCTLSILDDTSFSYANLNERNKSLPSRDKYQKRIWAFSNSMRSGYSLFVRSKQADKYADLIKGFSPYLQEKIAQGYGCYRKFGRERCQVDCQGIRLPLDESILSMASDIEVWLDNEMPGSLIKKRL